MGGNEQGHHPIAGRKVLFYHTSLNTRPDWPAVTSGASATIVSDAVMNPFDGQASSILKNVMPLMFPSHQTTHASPRVTPQLDMAVPTDGLQE